MGLVGRRYNLRYQKWLSGSVILIKQLQGPDTHVIKSSSPPLPPPLYEYFLRLYLWWPPFRQRRQEPQSSTNSVLLLQQLYIGSLCTIIEEKSLL